MKKLKVALPILLVIGIIIFWFFYPLRSLLVMSVYSGQMSGESVMRKNGFTVDMPSGEGWYPFVMTYNAAGFRDWSGIDADMSIMYNFGAFDMLKRTSSIYDTKSDKYSAFYGAYIIRKNGGEFGFSDGGEINTNEIETAFKYDYTQLVMSAFGCTDLVFEVTDYDIKNDVHIADCEGWTLMDAKLRVNGAAHNYNGDKTPYLQYGIPMEKVQKDFAEIELYGRIYVKYLEEYKCTIMIYVMAPAEKTISDCDREILNKTRIKGLY
jgi:hypothetical protein